MLKGYTVVCSNSPNKFPRNRRLYVPRIILDKIPDLCITPESIIVVMMLNRTIRHNLILRGQDLSIIPTIVFLSDIGTAKLAQIPKNMFEISDLEVGELYSMYVLEHEMSKDRLLLIHRLPKEAIPDGEKEVVATLQ